MTDPTVLDHILAGLLVAFAVYGLIRGRRVMGDQELDTRERLLVYWLNGGILVLAAVATCAVWVLGDRSLAALGLTWHQSSPVVGGLIAAAFVAWMLLETWLSASTAARRSRTLARLRRDVPFLPRTAREARHFSVLGASAGLTEEIIARGFAISYLTAVMGDDLQGTIAAVALPAVGFAVAHRYQGWTAIGKIFVLSIAFGAIFVATESLLVPIVFHGLLDVAGGWIAFRLAARERDAA